MYKPLVSICMITYNHEKYIAKAIEGVLLQKTAFAIELVIGEDRSTDDTRPICLTYKNKYPDIIKLRLLDHNIGAIPNFIENLKACSGKYIALCEGDDYWTNPYKLQKQVEFLEANKDYSLCFHNALVKYEGQNIEDKLFWQDNFKNSIAIEDVIEKNYMPTASIVFRSDDLKIPLWFNYIYNGDYALQLLLATQGKIKYLNEVMCVYLKQPRGFNATMRQEMILRHRIILMAYFDSYTDFEYHDCIERSTADLFVQYDAILSGITKKIQNMLFFSYLVRKLSKLFKRK